MEAIYSSLPEARNPRKVIFITTIATLLIGIVLWKYSQKVNSYRAKKY